MIIKCGETSSEYVIIEEYDSDESLEQFVYGRNGDTIEESIIRSYAIQILLALTNYTDKGIVHKNINLESIFICGNGRLKLTNSVKAKRAYGQSKLSKEIALTKKGRYLSPEIKSLKDLSLKSDVWAFGVIMLELAYGRDAYEDSEIIGMDSTKIREEFNSKGGYSYRMSRFIARCFERESAKRAAVERLLEDDWLREDILNANDYIIESGKKN